MAAGHFIAHRNLTLLRNVAANYQINARAKLRGILAGEYFNIYNRAVFAVRHAQRGISYLAGLFAKNGTQQALLCGQLRFALGGNLTNQNVARANLGANANNAAFVQVF